jgi:hypothetical protein
VVMKSSSIFWDVIMCSPLKACWRFGKTCQLHLQSWKMSQARNQRKARSKHSSCMLLWHVTWLPMDYMGLYPRWWNSSGLKLFLPSFL